MLFLKKGPGCFFNFLWGIKILGHHICYNQFAWKTRCCANSAILQQGLK